MAQHTDEPHVSVDVTVHLREDSMTHDLLVLRASVAERMVRGSGSVRVDVSGVQRVSSEVVHVLLWARRNCARRGVAFAVDGAGTRTSTVLGRCGLHRSPVLQVET